MSVAWIVARQTKVCPTLPLAALSASQIARAWVETRRDRRRGRSLINRLCLRRAAAPVIAPDQISASDDQQDWPYAVEQIGNPKIQHRKSADADQQCAEQIHAPLQKELQPFVFYAKVFASAQTLRRLKGVVNRIEVETGDAHAERYFERPSEDVREHPQSRDGQEMRQRLDVLAVIGGAHSGN